MAEDNDTGKYHLKISEINKRLEEYMQELYIKETYLSYLATMTRFCRYSTRNTLLIHMQMPEASKLTDYHTWKGKYDRYVKKNEKCIRILAPRQKKASDNETEIKKPITKYKLIPTFDISQTDGKPLPELTEPDVKNNIEMLTDALKRASSPETANQDTDGDNRKEMTSMRIASVAIREISYVKYREAVAFYSEEESETEKDAETREFECESIYCSICLYYSIEIYSVGFDNIASWSREREITEKMQTLDIIRKTTAAVIESIDAKLAEVAAEQSKNVSVETRAETGTVTSEVSGPKEFAGRYDKMNIDAITVEKLSPGDADGLTDDEEEPAYNGTMPDPAIGISERDLYGYRGSDMLPLTRDRALELFEKDFIVFMLYEDNTESMVLNREEIIIGHNYLYGVVRADWETSQEYAEMTRPVNKHAIIETAAENPLSYTAPAESDKNVKQSLQSPVYDNNKRPPAVKNKPTIISRIREIAAYQSAGRADIRIGQSTVKE